MRKFHYVMLLVSGCSSPPVYPKIAGQVQAEQIVWENIYHEMPQSIPDIIWVTGADLNCTGTPAGESGSVEGFLMGDLCVIGSYTPDSDLAKIALSDGEKISHTAFAHELLHAKKYMDVGNQDLIHSDPGFFNHGGTVSVTNDILSEAGL